MSKKPRSRHSLVKDWHLWSDVTRTVEPLTSTAPFNPDDFIDPKQQADLVSSAARKVRQDTKRQDAKKEVKPKSPTAPSYTPPISKPKNRFDKIIEPGMHKRVVRGHVAIDGTIDLHGLRQHEAHAALVRFINARFDRGDRTLLVITGKGIKTSREGDIQERGVLRHMLPRWLHEAALSPMISGWQTAAQGHGGEGAYYVRLRRPDK